MFTGHCRKSSQDCASTSANSRQSNAQHGYLLGRNPHCGYDPRTIVPLTGIAATCCKSLKLLHATWKRHQRPPQRTITYIVIRWLSDPDQGSTVSSVCQFGGMTCVFYRRKKTEDWVRYGTQLISHFLAADVQNQRSWLYEERRRLDDDQRQWLTIRTNQ